MSVLEWVQCISYVACIVAGGFYSGIETGIISIHPVRLMHRVKEEVRGAAALLGFAENSDRLLGTTLVGTNLCGVMAAIISASFAKNNYGAVGESVAGAVTAVLLLVFAEYLPKAWFHSRPMIRSLRFVGALTLSEKILHPLANVCMAVSKLLLHRKVSFGRPGLFATKEDFKHLTDEGAAHGAISHRERSMINRVFELSDKSAKDIMVPRKEMVFVEHNDTKDDFFDIVRRSGFTRMPVFDSGKNVFVGILNVFDVLSQRDKHAEEPVVSLARPLFAVQENMPVDDVLPLMRRHRQPLCLVKNADGDVVGMLTTEDILEEIVGTL
ncbi:MAG: hemolysin family protein [Verrucomicrobia bacterium]|nr:hemolysin family protein [Verrucomicrobiota bacterium]